jgi:ABC-type multidrug transport system fused ATPase/permease subunit
MVTNQLHFLRHVDYVLLIKDGAIAERGTFEELRSTGKEFQTLLEQAGERGEARLQCLATKDGFG